MLHGVIVKRDDSRCAYGQVHGIQQALDFALPSRRYHPRNGVTLAHVTSADIALGDGLEEAGQQAGINKSLGLGGLCHNARLDCHAE